MNKDVENILSIGVCGGLIAVVVLGVKQIIKSSDEAQAKREAEEAEWQEYRRNRLEKEDFNARIHKATLLNKHLSNDDRAYVFDKACYLQNNVLSAYVIRETFDKYCDELNAFLSRLTLGDDDSVNAYVLYLKNKDIKQAEKDKESAIRKSEQDKLDLEREKIHAEKAKYKMQLDAEEKKGEHLVEAIKAVAGQKESKSDVNVTINNDKGEK